MAIPVMIASAVGAANVQTDDAATPTDSETSVSAELAAAIADGRTLDGSGNNVDDPSLGQVGTIYSRVAEATDADGVGALVDRPDARYVSNRIFNDSNKATDEFPDDLEIDADNLIDDPSILDFVLADVITANTDVDTDDIPANVFVLDTSATLGGETIEPAADSDADPTVDSLPDEATDAGQHDGDDVEDGGNGPTRSARRRSAPGRPRSTRWITPWRRKRSGLTSMGS